MKFTTDHSFLAWSAKVDPAVVGLQLGVAGALEERFTDFLQLRQTDVATARDVDRGKVERQAEQIIAQCFRDVFVDLIAGLANEAAGERACDDQPSLPAPSATASEHRFRRSEGLKPSGLRKAWTKPTSVRFPSASIRSTSSVSIEWPKR